MLIEIKSWFNGSVLFSLETKSLKLCLMEAVFSGANLCGANFDIAPATDKESIDALDKVREIILDKEDRLNMGHWHDDNEWVNRTCAEEAFCGTTHCLAGWLQVCSINPEIKRLEPALAGLLCAPVASRHFYGTNEATLEWLRDREYAKELEAK